MPMAVTFGLASWWLSDDENRRMISETVAEARSSLESRPEFMVRLMAVDGADDALAADIREVVPLDFPLSSFDLDLGDSTRQVLAGIRSAYQPESLVGRLVVVVANLQPREMRFGVSEGMVLTGGDDDSTLGVVTFDRELKPGDKVT